jgi:hypothetical protein
MTVTLLGGVTFYAPIGTDWARYLEESFLFSACEDTRGPTSSMRRIGPMSCKGPSNCMQPGAASTRINSPGDELLTRCP